VLSGDSRSDGLEWACGNPFLVVEVPSHEDETARERAEKMALETSEDRHVSAGDIKGMAVDERTARLVGEATIDDAERLGDQLARAAADRRTDARRPFGSCLASGNPALWPIAFSLIPRACC
jgi:hypothetical protein